MISRLLTFLILPPHISAFERNYLARMNRIARVFFLAHAPLLAGVAYLCHTGVLKALALTCLMLSGPMVAPLAFENPRHITRVFGVAAMGLGALLVHFGQGPMQIEMHFYFFVLLGLLVVFADPVVILIAAATVVLHHLILFATLPPSLFNYQASIWSVAVHAVFVLFESAAAVWVSRTFFDSVLGLEHVVEARTSELQRQTTSLRLMLDNVGQGFVTCDLRGVLSTERSASFDRWFGAISPEMRIGDCLRTLDETAAQELEMGLEQLADDVLPVELLLTQLPSRIANHSLALDFDYKPIYTDNALSHVLVIVSDVTYRLERERAESEAKEMLAIFEAAVHDRAGFVDFMKEASALVAAATAPTTPMETVKRHVHTLKGACGLLQLTSMVTFCHELEERLAEATELPLAEEVRLVSRWSAFSTKFTHIFGRLEEVLHVSRAELADLLKAVEEGAASEVVAERLKQWTLEPTAVRLERFAEQARGMARRLNKGAVEVRVEHNGVRLPRAAWAPFWSSFSHVVRNAIDHGLELPGERLAHRKPPAGRVSLSTVVEGDDVVIGIVDDGRGINWSEVRARAVERGISVRTSDELSLALFEDGLTTLATPTHDSGRGVGLGAVRAICERMGGRVQIQTTLGQSTRVEIRIPRHHAA